jgi:hypothetical protein
VAIAPGVLRFEDASLVDFLSESEGVGGGVCVCVWGGGGSSFCLLRFARWNILR